jgi:hypothetical protein
MANGTDPQPQAQAAPTGPIAQATTAPQFPLYITDKTTVGDPIQWADTTVQLYDLSFLGIHFGSGVNDEMSNRLIEAQKTMYLQALTEKQQADPSVTQVSESDFGKWCWLSQEPSDSGAPLISAIQKHVGLKDQKHPNSRHASGSAVDVNLFCNPYIPTRSGQTLGGELQNFDKDFFTVNPSFTARSFHEQKIWGPAFEVFDRAFKLCYGQPCDLNAEDMHLRFKRLSVAVQAYFLYAYPFRPGGANDNPQPKSAADFATGFGSDFDDGNFDPGAVDAAGNNLAQSMQTNRQGTLDAFYNQIIADYTTVQRITVSGNLMIHSDLSISFPVQRQRDPCRGIFNIRKEVFVALVQGQKMRWGGCMFGARASGDTMHFDLDGHIVDGKMHANV